MKDQTSAIPLDCKIKIKTLPAGRALNSDTWRKKGGMSGGSSGSTRGVCSCNGMGVVPAAFTNHVVAVNSPAFGR